MALPARRIPESVAHLDIEIVAAALIRHDANVRNTARALGVPSASIASWCWSINAWRRPRSKPSSCVSTTPRPICAKHCVAVIHGGVTRRARSCCAMCSARRSGGYSVTVQPAVESRGECRTGAAGVHYAVSWGQRRTTTRSRTASLILPSEDEEATDVVDIRRRGTMLATSAMMTALSMASFRRRLRW